MQESPEREENQAPQTEPSSPQTTELSPQTTEQSPQTEQAKKKKKPKTKYVDDGHTVYSMEALTGKVPEEKDRPQLSKKERWALIRAAFSHYLPPALIVIGGFTLAALLVYFWLT